MAEPKLSIKQMNTERVKDEHGEYNFRHQPRMTLARRYIADNDPRVAWASPAAVLDAVLGDAGGDHACSHGVGVENVADRDDVARHRHPSLVDETEKRRSRHLDSFCDRS